MLLSVVGENCQNNPIEVKLVQVLLNHWLGQNQRTLLIVDGIVGPLTSGAIKGFQGASGIIHDGRVDPNGPTIKALVNFQLESIRAALLNDPNGRRLLKSSPLEQSSAADFLTGLRAIVKKADQV